MKKKIFGAVVVVALVMGAMINVNLSKESDSKGDLALNNVEALAEGEIGPIFYNWKDTQFTCTRTVGWDFWAKYETTTTYLYMGCGYGQGSCPQPAGC